MPPIYAEIAIRHSPRPSPSAKPEPLLQTNSERQRREVWYSNQRALSTDLKPAGAFNYAVKQVCAAKDGGFDGIFAAHHYALGTGKNMSSPSHC